MSSQACTSAGSRSPPLLRATQSLLEALRTCMAPALYLDSLTQLTQLHDASQVGVRVRAWRQLAQHAGLALHELDDERKAHAVSQLCNSASAVLSAEAISGGAEVHHQSTVQRHALAVLSAVTKVGMTVDEASMQLGDCVMLHHSVILQQLLSVCKLCQDACGTRPPVGLGFHTRAGCSLLLVACRCILTCDVSVIWHCSGLRLDQLQS